MTLSDVGDERIDLRLLRGVQLWRTIVGATRAKEMVHDVDGIMRDRACAPADVIVVRADRDVFVAQLEITATNHGDDVSRWILGRGFDKARCRSHDGSDFTRPRAVDIRSEKRFGDVLVDVQERR